MPRYLVTMPIKGTVEVEVEADDEDGAVLQAVTNVTMDDIIGWWECDDEAEVEQLSAPDSDGEAK